MEIRPDNCEDIIKISYKNLIGLTGIFGEFPDLDVSNIQKTVILYQNSEVFIEIIYSGLELQRLINLAKKQITNSFLHHISKRRQHIAFRVLNSQLKFAKEIGIEKLKCIAARGSGVIPSLSGYIIMGKLGFIMYLPEERKEFYFLVKNNHYKERSIFKLLQTSGGLGVWQEKGFRWHAEFKLSQSYKTQSVKNFNQYAKSRNLLVG